VTQLQINILDSTCRCLSDFFETALRQNPCFRQVREIQSKTFPLCLESYVKPYRERKIDVSPFSFPLHAHDCRIYSCVYWGVFCNWPPLGTVFTGSASDRHRAASRIDSVALRRRPRVLVISMQFPPSTLMLRNSSASPSGRCREASASLGFDPMKDSVQ